MLLGCVGTEILLVIFLSLSQSLHDWAQHFCWSLGERVVGISGWLESLVVSCLVKSITVSSVATVATKQGSKGNTEQWKDERSKDKDEKSEDDGILDGRGIEWWTWCHRCRQQCSLIWDRPPRPHKFQLRMLRRGRRLKLRIATSFFLSCVLLWLVWLCTVRCTH